MVSYQDSLLNELIVDNFAGGGGASIGIELATGRPVDIAINHDEDAIAMHKVNHPCTTHYQEDVFAINPEEVTSGRPVGIAWFSPDCKHFSKAKGGKPVEKKVRGLSWVILRWAMSKVSPRCIFMENVEEIKTWGPLVEIDGKMRPDRTREGETFNGFIAMLTDGIDKAHPAFMEACEFLKIDPNCEQGDKLANGLGYKVDYKVLKACDYGAPTKRKRFYMVARRDGLPIVFPKPTHGVGERLKPYRTAAECIDWSIPCPSIFSRKKALAVNTQKRIARGLDKFVLKNPRPFIMEMNFQNAAQDPKKPMTTQTTANHHYLITPEIVRIGQTGSENRASGANEPLRTICVKNEHCLATPILTKFQQNSLGQLPERPLDTVMAGATRFGTVMPSILQYHSEQTKGEVRGQQADEPIMTIDTQPRYGINACYISKYFSGEKQKGANIEEPLPTVTGIDHNAVVESHLCVLRKNTDCKPLDEQLPTLTTSAGHFAQVVTYIQKLDSTQDLKNWNKVRDLLNKYAGYSIKEDEILILEINGVQHFIADIGMRMLKAKELKLAQGFPEDYIIDIEPYIGKKYSEAKQIARLGNAVCPQVATALIRANCADMAYRKQLYTVEELNAAMCG